MLKVSIALCCALENHTKAGAAAKLPAAVNSVMFDITLCAGDRDVLERNDFPASSTKIALPSQAIASAMFDAAATQAASIVIMYKLA